MKALESMKGFSLLEMAIVLVALGGAALAGVRLYGQLQGMNADPASRRQFTRLEDAIVGFAFVHGRLPCPDANADGVEDCGSATGRGDLPWKTLGLSVNLRNRPGLPLTYLVFRINTGGEGATSRDLSAMDDRQMPLLPTGALPPVAFETMLGAVNAFDLCEALHGAGVGIAPANALHAGTGANARPLAWAVIDPGADDADGDGRMLDGANTTGMGIERLDKSLTPLYDDRVYGMGPMELWSRLGCGPAFAAGGHAHPDAALEAAIMDQAMQDYATQLSIMQDLASAALASAEGDVLAAAAGIPETLATVLNATAKSLLGDATGTASMPVAVAAVAANAAAVALAAVARDAARNQVNAIGNLIVSFNSTSFSATSGLPAAAALLHANIRNHAVNADSAGLYGP